MELLIAGTAFVMGLLIYLLVSKSKEVVTLKENAKEHVANLIAENNKEMLTLRESKNALYDKLSAEYILLKAGDVEKQKYIDTLKNASAVIEARLAKCQYDLKLQTERAESLNRTLNDKNDELIRILEKIEETEVEETTSGDIVNLTSGYSAVSIDEVVSDIVTDAPTKKNLYELYVDTLKPTEVEKLIADVTSALKTNKRLNVTVTNFTAKIQNRYELAAKVFSVAHKPGKGKSALKKYYDGFLTFRKNTPSTQEA